MAQNQYPGFQGEKQTSAHTLLCYFGWKVIDVFSFSIP